MLLQIILILFLTEPIYACKDSSAAALLIDIDYVAAIVYVKWQVFDSVEERLCKRKFFIFVGEVILRVGL